jgi:crossover junction endodeoxyribonuclease RuvC
MRVLGIDCGTQRTGFGVVDSDGGAHAFVTAGVIRTSAKQPLELRLVAIARGLRQVIHRHRPESAAVEGVFHSLNARTGLKLAHVRGATLLTVAEAGLELGEYSPAEVKISVVGYGRAEKEQVQMMVRSLLRLESEKLPEDACDALAVAICHAVNAATRRRLEAGA